MSKKISQIYLHDPMQKHRYQVIIKPGGARCNLACSYCYYLHKDELLAAGDSQLRADDSAPTGPSVMNEGTLEKLISQYIAGNDHQEIVFSWQGGEPTLLGLDFFAKALKLQKKYNHQGKVIANTLQTNGTLLDESWALFLKEHGFLVGLSIDGPAEFHDRYRRDRQGAGTFRQVMAGLEHLQKHDVPFTTLTTVNNHNGREPLAIYDFLTQTVGSTYVQLNPCVEPQQFTKCAPHHWEKGSLPVVKDYVSSERIRHFVTPWSVEPEVWGHFLTSIFELWSQRDLGRVLVNWFETAVAQTLKLPAQICLTGQICGKGVAVLPDGGVYSCDHYVNREYYLGNICQKPLNELVFSAKQQAFAFKKQRELSAECLACPHGLLCWGQCPRHRFVKTSHSPYPLNYLCLGFKYFYTQARPKLFAIAESLGKNEQTK